ncbi:hypothetical protein [Adonisia turfae]|uniref:hypothetical protein n=1 Tax=Adonisia turfae TaxID=2950184 RepID=UPI002029A8BF|nr:hypothetical protein [Adonisia turfae]
MRQSVSCKYDRCNSIKLSNVKIGCLNASTVESGTYDYFTEAIVGESEVVGYVPLPNEVCNLAFDHFTDKRIGTAFGGEAPTSLTIEALVKVEREL